MRFLTGRPSIDLDYFLETIDAFWALAASFIFLVFWTELLLERAFDESPLLDRDKTRLGRLASLPLLDAERAPRFFLFACFFDDELRLGGRWIVAGLLLFVAAL